MSIPGFHSELPPPASSRSDWADASGSSLAAVEPARPCCQACDSYCARYPNSQWCASCRRNCSVCGY